MAFSTPCSLYVWLLALSLSIGRAEAFLIGRTRGIASLAHITTSPRCLASRRIRSSSTSTANDDAIVITTDTTRPTSNKTAPQSYYDAIISGGGPAGLLTAIMLSQKFGPRYRIALCERRRSEPPRAADATVWNDVARFYCLGIGFRGQRALQKFGLYDDFVAASVAVHGRRDWQPGQTTAEGGRITPAKKDVVSRILPREKLVGVLYHHLVENYIMEQNATIDLLYGYEVNPLDFGQHPSDEVTVMIAKCQDDYSNSTTNNANTDESDPLCDVELFTKATTKLLIGADGSARTVANAMEREDRDRRRRKNPWRRLFSPSPFRVTRFEDDNPRVYKSVPIQLPSDWPCDLNYSARSTGNRITLEALPSGEGGNLCALLLMKPDDALAQGKVNPQHLRDFFDEEFPQFSSLIPDDEMERVALKPSSSLPAFRYAGPRLHMGHRTLVLGDAAHTVKPYYGLGANSALEDVQVLADVLDDVSRTDSSSSRGRVDDASHHDIIPRVVPLFSDRRAADSRALVTISRNMDRPGKMFYVNFLLPLILDGAFHKVAPFIFSPNMFGMFQRQDLGFRQIQQKKRFDRVLQFAVLVSLLTGTGWGIKMLIGWISRITGTGRPVVTLGLALTIAFATVLRKTVSTTRKKTNLA